MNFYYDVFIKMFLTNFAVPLSTKQSPNLHMPHHLAEDIINHGLIFFQTNTKDQHINLQAVGMNISIMM